MRALEATLNAKKASTFEVPVSLALEMTAKDHGYQGKTSHLSVSNRVNKFMVNHKKSTV